MKHSLKLLTFLVILPTVVNAQTNVKLGVRAGLNYVNNVIVRDNWNGLHDEREFRFGYHFGVLSKFNLTKKISTSLEINYSNQGYHFDGYETSDPSGPQNVNYNYLNVPVFFEYHPISKLTLQAGPQIGYMISAKNKFKTETIDLIEFWETNGFDSVINRFSFGLGLGSEVLLTENLLIGLRYFHGLSSIIDSEVQLTDEHGNPVTSAKIKDQSRNFQLSFAYLIW